jgi:hypothetical protein
MASAGVTDLVLTHNSFDLERELEPRIPRMGTNDQGVPQTHFFTRKKNTDYLLTPSLFVILV